MCFKTLHKLEDPYVTAYMGLENKQMLILNTKGNLISIFSRNLIIFTIKIKEFSSFLNHPHKMTTWMAI